VTELTGSIGLKPEAGEDNAGALCVADTEVSNGFVKDGSSLQYVFETNESGNRKRSSKILPVCGMCGKKFVCVTTMKRHLVTHTGEKPFSCKVCGKQYTQKGNLRVHERTHRNDRPFECNICHQKFYRKEPMQKHQWRQHGIFHFKSRPSASSNNNINNNNQLGIIGAEGVLYSTINQRVEEAITVNTTVGLATISSLLPQQEEAQVDQIPVSYVVEQQQQQEDSTVYTQIEFLQEETVQTVDSVEPIPAAEVPEALEETVVVTTETVEEETAEETSERPMKLKMKLAQAYMKEIEESREREERRDGRGEFREEPRDSRLNIKEDSGDWTELVTMQRIHFNLGDIRLSSSDSSNSIQQSSNPNSTPNSRPHSRMPEQVQLPVEQAELRIVEEQEVHLEAREATAEVKDKESLEFLCRSCNTRCLVPDPYSFRCPTCNMKYTSLPTHMIADPLQCIGCTQVFAHKPALKLHQSSTDKERPFRCCKCGFEFRQKAHLQKHQWRIHRKKFDADTSVREAEALLSAVEDISAQKTMTPPQYARLEQTEVTPLDLSPAKMYGTAGSITKWVEQVETARTPVIPDISIHKQSPNSATANAPLARFKELLDAPVQQKEEVQFRIINSLSGRQDETLTIRLVDPDPSQDAWDRKPVVAVKSKPPQPQFQAVTDNPLLNQIMVSREPSPIRTSVSITRASKRPRTDLQASSSISHVITASTSRPRHPSVDNNQPADLSLRPRYDTTAETRLKSPLSLVTTPLRLDTEYSTVSPPLNLSSPQVSPYDYRVTKSNIISGHFQRLKSQDERSGI